MPITGAAFYSVRWRDDPRRIGLARPVDEGSPDDKRVERRMRKPGFVEEWGEQQYVLHGAGKFSDYQPEVRALRLCSPRMRDVLDAARGPLDVVQWLPAQVTDATGETRPYWVLHFPEPTEDLLDLDRTRYGPLDVVVRGVVDARKAAGRHVFASPDGRSVSFLVSAETKSKIEDAGLIGIDISDYPTSG